MSAMALAASPRLPVALRDTARTVTALATEQYAFEALRAQCNAQIADLRSELGACGIADDTIADAVYAQCALLDEAALKHLTGNARENWEKRPLQEEHFSRNDAGDELIRRIEGCLHEPRTAPVLLAIFAAVLSLGFVGRFAVDGSAARTALIRSLDERLGHKPAAEENQAPPASIIVNRTSARAIRIFPLTWVVISCVALGVVWFAVDRWFIASIAQLAR